MPWKLKRSGGDVLVVREDTGKVVARHKSRKKALRHLSALYSIEKASFADASERGRYAAEQRWKGHVKADVARSIMDRVKSYGGLSVKILSGDEPTTGFMVAVRGLNMEVPEDEFFDAKKGRAALAEFLKRHREELSGDKYLGLWWDAKNKEVVLDVVDNIVDRDEAVAAGEERNQQSIWDVENGEEISTGGTGDRAAEGAVGKAAEADFGDDGRGDRQVRGPSVGERDFEFGDAEKVEGVLVAVSEDGDRLVQTGVTSDLRWLGLEDAFSGPVSVEPIPYGRIEFSDGGWQRVKSIDSILRTGFWTQVGPINRVEDASSPFEKAAFASRSEAARYAAQQRWKGHVKAEADIPDKMPKAIPPSEQLTPTFDAEEAKRTGRPYGPLVTLEDSPVVKKVMDVAEKALERYVQSMQVFRPLLEADNPEYTEWQKKRDQIVADHLAESPNATDDELWERVISRIGRQPKYPPSEFPTTFRTWVEEGKVPEAAGKEYLEAIDAYNEAVKDARKVIEKEVLGTLGIDVRTDPKYNWSTEWFDAKTGEQIDTSDRYKEGSGSRVRVLQKVAEMGARSIIWEVDQWPKVLSTTIRGKPTGYLRPEVREYLGSPEYRRYLGLQQRMIDDPQTRVVVFVPPRRLGAVMTDGRLKTQHETGKSGGFIDKGSEHRKGWEGWSLGMHPDMDDTKRPIFGVLAVGGVREPYAYGAEQYGRVGIVLKREVHSRSTFTNTDSLNGWSGTPLAGQQQKLSITLEEGQLSGGRAASGGWGESPNYHEAQVFGGVSLKDIDYVTVPRGAVAKSALDKVRKAGIRVVEYDSENIHSGEKEKYGKGGEIKQPETKDGLWGVLPEPAEKMQSRLEIIDALLKGRFASRSEAARYAAEQRWKGHVKDEGGDRVARLKAMLTPEIVSRLMAAGENFDSRGRRQGQVTGAEGYLWDETPAGLVNVQNIPSTGQWDEKTQTFRPPNGEMMQVYLPNRKAMEIDDQVNAIGMVAHEIVMERLEASVGEALKDLPRLEAEAKELSTLAMDRRTLIRQEFGVRPESNAKSAKWGMAQWYDPTELKAIGGSFPDPPNGASPKYRTAADAAKTALDNWEQAHVASVGADGMLNSWMKLYSLQGQSTFFLRTKIERGEPTGLTEADERDFVRLFERSQAANKARLDAVNTFRDNAIKAAKLYEKEAFGETIGETNKRSLAAQERLAKAHAEAESSYGREFSKLAEELGIKMFDGNLGGQTAFTRIKALDFAESLKVLPQEYVERPFSQFRIEVKRQARGGSWNSLSFDGVRPQVLSTDGSKSTNLHEVTHAAADAIPFVSMIQRTMNARRMMGTRVDPVEYVQEPRRENDPPEVASYVRRQQSTFVRRPLETVIREGVERYYSGSYSYGNRFVRDQFTDGYAGRVYDDDARETMTRGIEYLFGRDHKGGVPKDVDHVASVMGTLLVVGLSRVEAS